MHLMPHVTAMGVSYYKDSGIYNMPVKKCTGSIIKKVVAYKTGQNIWHAAIVAAPSDTSEAACLQSDG